MRTALENLMATLITEGWANRSDGDVAAPTGHFALIVIAPAELDEVAAAFADDLALYGVSPTDLVGNWTVVEDSDGNVRVDGHLTEADATFAYTILAIDYEEWAA